MKLEPIIPFEPVAASEFPKGDQWTAQIKWDGVRILSYFDGERTKLFNRRLNERTLQYPELLQAESYCSADSFILDGEVIAFENGSPSFHEVMKRDSLRSAQRIQEQKGTVPITYMIFDLIYLNGVWVKDKKLRDRQTLLSSIIRPNVQVQVVPSYSDIAGLYRVAEQHRLEGIVIKDLNSTYSIDGKDKRWMKKKNVQDLIAVVGGVTLRDGIVNALLLGLYDDAGRFWYIGHAGSGKLTMNDWRTLTQLITTMTVRSMPFANKPERYKDAIWIEPRLTVKINYMEWTSNKTLRQPTIQAFLDVPPQECTFS
ncbi:ATP-dependent DNA ligase [Paenibacillus spongiae]|uniref:DNA ligase (ATP) n=1 Tax=Paenibacillus spongiae TaxID=2909671 RepID=A0ABY5SC94_9BACL|nr:RNA ligase family protein [Paenibacillus spongiae]UVI31145.1 DNA ligase [Paenibacillus spongiae]